MHHARLAHVMLGPFVSLPSQIDVESIITISGVHDERLQREKVILEKRIPENLEKTVSALMASTRLFGRIKAFLMTIWKQASWKRLFHSHKLLCELIEMFGYRPRRDSDVGRG